LDITKVILTLYSFTLVNIIMNSYTAFVGHRLLASGSLPEVARAVKRAFERGVGETILIFDDRTGRNFDINLQGTEMEVVASAADPFSKPAAEAEPRGPGRPRLGVVGREVTLLPRHWEWLNEQPGGASVALRKLVETARRANPDKDRARQARDAAYYFISAIGGDYPGFEEASRALFANDRPRFRELIGGWPTDIAAHALALIAAGD
jgi:hypothetical protein